MELRRHEIPDFDDYPFSIPAIRDLTSLDLDPSVTFLTGENGTGKSTLVEAIAVAAGFNPEGGTRNFNFSTRQSHSPLHDHLTLVRGPGFRTGFFLRGESFFNVATQIEEMGMHDGERPAYGDVRLHEQSHGESLVTLVLERFEGGTFNLLDEPEAGLSFHGCLRLLAGIHDLVRAGAQFLVATHSPVLLAYPDATIYQLDHDGVTRVGYRETDAYELTREFLDEPGRFFRHLFDDR